MGFNPFRQTRPGAVDIAMVVATLLIALGFVLWAILA